MNIELMNLQAEYDSNEANIQILEKTTVEDREFQDAMNKQYPYPLLYQDKALMAQMHLAAMKEHEGLIELQDRYMRRKELQQAIKEMEDVHNQG